VQDTARKYLRTLVAVGVLFPLTAGASQKPYEPSQEFWGAVDVATQDYCSPGNILVACHKGGLLDDLSRFKLPELGALGLVKLRGGKRTILLTITANQSTYTVYTAAGSPTDPVDVILTINTSVQVTGGYPTIIGTGSWTSGSTLKIVNNGYVTGGGGNGGSGQECDSSSLAVTGVGVGGTGGIAISLGVSTTIDNTNGYIFGGGGGGGGGSAAGLQTSAPFTTRAGGGGGGGGAGGGGGGAGGNANDGGLYNGQNGSTAGSDPTLTNQGGPGGAGGLNFVGTVGGVGGDGGDWGQSGNTGGTGTPNFASNGAGGGSNGSAVATNGNSLTWLAGNNGTQVKGGVS
jgi:hypothetical protein